MDGEPRVARTHHACHGGEKEGFGVGGELAVGHKVDGIGGGLEGLGQFEGGRRVGPASDGNGGDALAAGGAGGVARADPAVAGEGDGAIVVENDGEARLVAQIFDGGDEGGLHGLGAFALHRARDINDIGEAAPPGLDAEEAGLVTRREQRIQRPAGPGVARPRARHRRQRAGVRRHRGEIGDRSGRGQVVQRERGALILDDEPGGTERPAQKFAQFLARHHREFDGLLILAPGARGTIQPAEREDQQQQCMNEERNRKTGERGVPPPALGCRRGSRHGRRDDCLRGDGDRRSH